MTGYVISREYGELCEGFAATNAELAVAVRNQRHASVTELAAERASWVEVMKRCPMFVQGEVRA